MDCIICTNAYTADGPHVPYVLQCAHTLCGNCLGQNDISHCPTCRGVVVPYSWKRNFTLIQVLESQKPAAACYQCHTALTKGKARICMTCSNKTEPNWSEKSNSVERSTAFYLCGDCVVDYHSGPDHQVKKVSDIQALSKRDGEECSEHLSSNFTDFYKELMVLELSEKDIVHAFEKDVNNAISLLAAASKVKNGGVTKEQIKTTIDKAHVELDKIVGAHRLAINAIKSLSKEINDSVSTTSVDNVASSTTPVNASAPTAQNPMQFSNISDEAADKLEDELFKAVVQKFRHVTSTTDAVAKCFAVVGKEEFGKPTTRIVFKYFVRCAVITWMSRFSSIYDSCGEMLRECLNNNQERESVLQGIADFCEWAVHTKQWEKEVYFWEKFAAIIARIISCNNSNGWYTPTIDTFTKTIQAASEVPLLNFAKKITEKGLVDY